MLNSDRDLPTSQLQSHKLNESSGFRLPGGGAVSQADATVSYPAMRATSHEEEKKKFVASKIYEGSETQKTSEGAPLAVNILGRHGSTPLLSDSISKMSAATSRKNIAQKRKDSIDMLRRNSHRLGSSSFNARLESQRGTLQPVRIIKREESGNFGEVAASTLTAMKPQGSKNVVKWSSNPVRFLVRLKAEGVGQD